MVSRAKYLVAPLVLDPIMGCPVGAESRLNITVNSRENGIPPEPDPKEKQCRGLP